MRIGPLAFVLGLAAILVTLGTVVLTNRPPLPVAADAPADQFSAMRAVQVLEDLMGDEIPHPVGSEEHARVRQRLLARLQALGLEVDVQDTTAAIPGRLAWVHNVVARLGDDRPGPAVMLASHYDSVPAGPGICDDGLGVAAMVEVARALGEQAPLPVPVVLVFSDAEEVGLMGARAFVDEHPWAKDVGVVVNLECAGTAGRSMMFETSENNGWLVDAYARAALHPETSSVYVEIYRHMPNDTDLSVYMGAGLPGLNLAANRHQQVHYHSAFDNLANLDRGTLQHEGETALAVTRELARTDLAQPPPGDALFADILGLVVVCWPAAIHLPVTLLFGLLLVAGLIRLARAGAVSRSGVLVGMAAWPVAVAAAGVLATAASWVISTVNSDEALFYGAIDTVRLSIWMAVVLGGAGIFALASRWAGAWDLLLGGWLWWTLIGVGLAVTLPGASVLWTMPAAVAAVAVAAVAWTRLVERPLVAAAVTIVSAVFAWLLWVEVVAGIEDAFGFEPALFVAIPLAMAVTAVAPLLVVEDGPARRLRASLLVMVAVVMVLGIATSVLSPPASERRPRTLNLRYHADLDEGVAWWILHRSPPPELAAVEDFAPREIAHSGVRRAWAAAAPDIPMPAPEVTPVEGAETSDEHCLRAHLRSLRQADEMTLVVPQEVQLEALSVAGRRVTPVGSGSHQLRLLGVPRDGFDLELRLGTVGPVELTVIETTRGLPEVARELIHARSPLGIPRRRGDLTRTVSRVWLRPPA